MKTSKEILTVESNIARLKAAARKIFIPRKSINYQFQNLRYGNRNQTQRTVIKKAQRRRINRDVAFSERRLLSLRELFFTPKEI